jgi:hypothetical protein
MTIATRTRKPRSKDRSICWLSKPTADRIGSLEITADKMRVGYWCRLLPSDFGTAFEVTNWLNDETYTVLIDAENGHHCDCPGFLRWNRCKHTSGLAALLATK